MPHCVLIGASKGIGYHTALNLLASGWTCTLLLRKPDAFSADEKMAPYVNSGKVSVVKGNAVNLEDVQRLFDRKADMVVTSVGGAFSLKAMGNDQPDLCTRAAVVLLQVLSKLSGPLPRVVGVSSMGLGGHEKCMPFAMRILYLGIKGPHQDKDGLEYLLTRASSSFPTDDSHIPPISILPRDLIPTAPEDLLPEVIIVRPALLLGGDEPPKARELTKVGETLYTYSTTRPEVGRFIADECVPGKDQWVGKKPVVGY